MKAKAILTLATVALLASPVFAQKGEKAPAKFPSQFGHIFAAEVYAVEPGIEAALLLTDEQRTKLAEALTATIHSPKLAELGGKIKKGDADAKAASEAYHAEREKALAEYKKSVDSILTAAQKATIKKVDDTVKGAIPSVLSAEQKEALSKATIKTKKEK